MGFCYTFGMKRKELAFQPWGRKAIAEGRKVLTSRCSGLAAVNKNPDEWIYGGENIHGQHIFYNKDDNKDGLLLRCPWQVGVDYDGVTVTAITAKRVQDMTAKELQQEGLPAIDGVHPKTVFAAIWDILRRDVNTRHERNPWRWEIQFRRAESNA